MSKVYKGLEIMKMISKGQIADRTRFDFENNNFAGEVEYYNGTLYWIMFDEEWNEIGKKNLFEMFNIQSTMVADFELIEDEIDIDNIKKFNISDEYTSAIINEDNIYTLFKTQNEIIKAVKKLNKEVKSIKE